LAVCAWADAASISVVMDFTQKIENGNGIIDLNSLATETLQARKAFESPANARPFLQGCYS
jgi:hypothetical protein